jgi:WD40 repeat protein
MFNINTGQLKMQVFDQYFVNGIARVSNKEIAVGNFKGEILIIDVIEMKIVRRMGSHKNFVWRVKVDMISSSKQLDADLIASASFDKTVKIWEWKSGSLVSSLEGHTEIVRSLELLTESYLLVSGSDDRSLKIWRLV